MNSYNNIYRETTKLVRYSCAVLFACFVFCYLFFIQGEVLAQAQFFHSHGVTRYSAVAGAVIITVALGVLQWVVCMVSRLPQRCHALSYLPSATALVALVNVAESPGDSMLEVWAWIVPAFAAAYIGLCVLARKIDRWLYNEEAEFITQVYPNYIILLVTVLAVGSLSRTNDVRFYELKTERLIMEGRYDEAARVGYKALVCSQRLTELRMYALGRSGRLGEEMFCYPQLYGSEGLVCVADTDSARRVNARNVCAFLGARCGGNVKSAMRYLELVVSNDSLRNPRAAEYYLCGLLLDKRADDFLRALPQFRDLSVPNACDSLPRSYKEALLLMSDESSALEGAIVIGSDSLGAVTDTLLTARYREYLAMKAGIMNERERENRTRRKFGDTFWWHYDYGK